MRRVSEPHGELEANSRVRDRQAAQGGLEFGVLLVAQQGSSSGRASGEGRSGI